MNSIKVRAGGAIALGILFLPFSLLARTNDGFTNGGGIPCIWRSLTGYPCPGCGLTRSLASISTFDFGAALHYNPEGFLFLAIAIAAVISPALLLQSAQSFRTLISTRSNTVVFAVAIALFAILWILNIIRVSTGFYPAA